MPIDLAALVDPAHTALVLQEVQNGVVGTPSALPALADAAAEMPTELPTGRTRLVGVARHVDRLAADDAEASVDPSTHTSSVRASRAGGTVSPSAFAVLRLITN